LQNKIKVLQGEVSLKNEAFSRLDQSVANQSGKLRTLEEENMRLKSSLRWVTVESERVIESLMTLQEKQVDTKLASLNKMLDSLTQKTQSLAGLKQA